MRWLPLAIVLLLVPGAQADLEDLSWAAETPGILSVAVVDCEASLPLVLASLEVLNEVLWRERVGLRFAVVPAASEPDIAAFLADERRAEALDRVTASAATDVVVACVDSAALRDASDHGVAGAAFGREADGVQTGALVLVDGDPRLDVAECPRPVALGADAYGPTVRHELLHAAGLWRHSAPGDDLLSPTQTYEHEGCGRIHTAMHGDVGPATVERLLALWPYEGAARENVDAWDRENGFPEHRSAPFRLIPAAGLHPVVEWTLAVLALGLVATWVLVVVLVVRRRR